MALDKLNNPDVLTLQARAEIVALARPKRPRTEAYSAGRYPFTYACDQIRSRLLYSSRAEAAGQITKLATQAGLPRQYVAQQLAEAYIIENNIERRRENG